MEKQWSKACEAREKTTLKLKWELLVMLTSSLPCRHSVRLETGTTAVKGGGLFTAV